MLRFESCQLQVGHRFYKAETKSKVEKLAYPDRQKVKTVQNLSFVNEQGEVEDPIMDDDD